MGDFLYNLYLDIMILKLPEIGNYSLEFLPAVLECDLFVPSANHNFMYYIQLGVSVFNVKQLKLFAL